MYRRYDDFQAAWTHTAESTLCVFRNCTDAAKNQRVTPDGRTLGFLAWHIVTTHTEMLAHAGIVIHVVDDKAPEPATFEEICALYEKSAKEVPEKVMAAWPEASLDEEVPMYGQKWKRGVVLSALISHEIHHRAQMTVLMRQAGLRVPGVFGPAKEDWAAYGIPAMP